MADRALNLQIFDKFCDEMSIKLSETEKLIVPKLLEHKRLKFIRGYVFDGDHLELEDIYLKTYAYIDDHDIFIATDLTGFIIIAFSGVCFLFSELYPRLENAFDNYRILLNDIKKYYDTI